ncbi:phage holin family protein [Lactobacillus sp. UCMA15818]|uniref:phage holin family protein n=1 Tax=Lactobacillaceae TaxID=33958 RepID=UPI0025B00B76|nr:phage holin family protein [Lactobacillus sp. UCMA15818]MDN2452750.1 phage holin family protein [Lactobacillus sp. UCMA15818]
MSFWRGALVNAVIFVSAAGFFPQAFHVSSIWISLLAAIILGLLNMFVKPILLLFSLPITFMTLGLFYFVINGFMLELTSYLVGSSFAFANFGAAFLLALILSLVNIVVTNYFKR